MKVPVLSSPLLLSARQAGGMGYCLHPSEGGPRIPRADKKRGRKEMGRQEARKEVGQKTQRDESTCP